jgi:hypothetical protein
MAKLSHRLPDLRSRLFQGLPNHGHPTNRGATDPNEDNGCVEEGTKFKILLL